MVYTLVPLQMCGKILAKTTQVLHIKHIQIPNNDQTGD